MQGLSVLVDKCHSDSLITIFETNLYEGNVVPFVEWNSSQVVDLHGSCNFIVMSNPPSDKQFPTYINSKTGTNSNKEKPEATNFYVNQYHISKRTKYFSKQANSTTVSIRLYKVISTPTQLIKYIYHYQIKPTQDRDGRDREKANPNYLITQNVVQQYPIYSIHSFNFVKKYYLTVPSPNPFCNNNVPPQISTIMPKVLEYERGRQQTIEITGVNLYPTEGYLYPQNLTNYAEGLCIRLMIFVTPGGGFKSMIIRFQHPFQLTDRYYYPVFKINDSFIAFQQCLIEFTDSVAALAESTIQYGMQFPYTLPDSLYPPNGGFFPMSLMDSVSFGSLRSLSSLSRAYPSGMPFMFAKANKCFFEANIESKSISLIDLAAHYGQLRPLLYLVVWHLETCGVFTARVRMNLDKYIMQSIHITYDGMVESLKECDELDSEFCSEQQLRELASQNLTSTEQQNIFSSYKTDYYISYKDKHTIEAYFTDDVTPNYLIDPLTGILFNYPVILPSGNTVSIQLAKLKPRFDIFSNKPFESEQSVILNRHLMEFVDDYIAAKVLSKITEINSSFDRHKEILYVLSLLKSKTTLNSTAVAIHQFTSVFWSHLNYFLPFISQLSTEEREIQFQTLLRGTFPVEVFISRLSKESCPESATALCKLFPTPSDAYETLNISKMLSNVSERQLGISIVFQFCSTCNINLLEMYLKQREEDEPDNINNINNINNNKELIDSLRGLETVKSLF